MQQHRKRTRVTLTVALLASALSGCRGSDNSSETGPELEAAVVEGLALVGEWKEAARIACDGSGEYRSATPIVLLHFVDNGEFEVAWRDVALGPRYGGLWHANAKNTSLAIFGLIGQVPAEVDPGGSLRFEENPVLGHEELVIEGMWFGAPQVVAAAKRACGYRFVRYGHDIDIGEAEVLDEEWAALNGTWRETTRISCETDMPLVPRHPIEQLILTPEGEFRVVAFDKSSGGHKLNYIGRYTLRRRGVIYFQSHSSGGKDFIGDYELERAADGTPESITIRGVNFAYATPPPCGYHFERTRGADQISTTYAKVMLDPGELEHCWIRLGHIELELTEPKEFILEPGKYELEVRSEPRGPSRDMTELGLRAGDAVSFVAMQERGHIVFGRVAE